MNSDEHGDRESFELVLPFVACKSEGGIYDDNSFSAGWTAGSLYAKLADRRLAATADMVRTDLVPQIDLIAMRHGYHMERSTEFDDGWTDIELTRIDDETTP